MALIRNDFILRLRSASSAAVFLLGTICASGFQSPASPRAAAAAPSVPAAVPASSPAIATVSGPRINPPSSNYSYPDAQTFTYAVDWRLMSAGRATLRVDTVNGERHIVANADSIGAVALLYHVHDRLETFFNPQTNCSLVLTKHTEEGFRRIETGIRYDYARKKAVLDERNVRAKNQKHEENDVPSCVTNTLAAAYYVASQPLLQGTSFSFPTSDGGKTADIAVAVEAREDVKTPAGSYKTIRISAEALSGPQKGKGKVWMWYSDDARHIPVQMRARAFWGTLTFQLAQINSGAADRIGQ